MKTQNSKLKTKNLTVAVLMGGISAERKISLISGKNVIKALKKIGKYEIKTYDPKTDLVKLIQDKDKMDIALPVLHGPYGEDGTIQGFLELLKIPYAFSSVLASSLAMNKLASRRIFESEGLSVPKYAVIRSPLSRKQLTRNRSALASLLRRTVDATLSSARSARLGPPLCAMSRVPRLG